MQNKSNSKEKFPLARPGRRIWAKVIDIALISLIILSLGFLVFCLDPKFAWGQPLVLQDNWRYGLFVSLVALIFFFLMLILPIFWKKTIGMKLLNLSYYKTDESPIGWSLFKRELFVWEIIVLVSFALGWTLTGLNNQKLIDSLLNGVNSMFNSNIPDEADKACYYAGTAFSAFYGALLLLLFAIIIGIFIKNGKPAFHDKFSSLVIFWKNNNKENNATSRQKTRDEDGVLGPGQLSQESLEEISNI